MTTQLIKYNAARLALAEAHAVDEVKDIRDKAEAMAAYARQAKDTEMIEWVTEIKVRAERRAGQLSSEMETQQGKKSTSSHDAKKSKEQQLADIGVSVQTANRWEKLAAVPEAQFEQAIAAAKEVAGEVTTAAMLRATKAQEPAKAKPIDKLPPAIAFPDELGKLKAEYLELFEAHTEQGKTIKELLEENDSMAAIIDSNDQLATLAAENKKLREINRILEERIRGLMGECSAAKRAAQAWQRKAEKAA